LHSCSVLQCVAGVALCCSVSQYLFLSSPLSGCNSQSKNIGKYRLHSCSSPLPFFNFGAARRSVLQQHTATNCNSSFLATTPSHSQSESHNLIRRWNFTKVKCRNEHYKHRGRWQPRPKNHTATHCNTLQHTATHWILWLTRPQRGLICKTNLTIWTGTPPKTPPPIPSPSSTYPWKHARPSVSP